MPSERKMIPIRLTADDEAELPPLKESIKSATGMAPSNSDLFRMGLAELKRKFQAPKKTSKKS